ncbi:hypothetical protein ABD91_20780 [Lysinibacillus sphaericus]|uniref:hypothetical protein n=1 Tax=Lysinibacillus sphaericus TaxID=1421 RepID=UPI0018CC92DE|nr:hypothetical protein [Lysinibacillus sphaericus]MBG9693178.1 hypothetical protein [Lysinibacillus sphaericus]
MDNVFEEAAINLGEEEFNNVVEAFMDVVDISVQVSVSKTYVPKIGKDGTIYSEDSDLHVTDYIEAISVRVNDEQIAYLVEDISESVKDEVLLELFSFYQNLDFDIESFNEAALKHANAFDFIRYEA